MTCSSAALNPEVSGDAGSVRLSIA
jgi:hypothetical protein